MQVGMLRLEGGTKAEKAPTYPLRGWTLPASPRRRGVRSLPPRRVIPFLHEGR